MDSNKQTQEPSLQAVSQSVTIMGPLPSAAEFSGYEKAHPGTTERLLVMAEREASHRQEVEKNVVKDSFKLNFSGQALGFVISLLSIVPAIIALTSLAAVFVGKNRQK